MRSCCKTDYLNFRFFETKLKRLKIAVNTRFLLNGKLEGFGRFTDEIFKRLVRNHPEHEFIFIFDRPYNEQFIYADNVTPVVLKPQARHPILFYIWFEISVKRFLKKHQPDIFVSPDGYLPLKWKGKELAVIHDLNFEHYPKDLPRSARKYLKRFFPKFAKRADRIATVSEYSRWDITQQYDVAADKIDVIYNAANDSFKPVDESTKEKVKSKWTGGRDYFVYLGSLHPRKNVHRLIAAFDAFKSADNSDLKLVIVGDKYWFNADMKAAFENLRFKEDVIFTGHLDFKDMVNVLASAFSLVYVSYFEGFGIPLIEAMKCDVPVICGDRTSLPEVAGEAAILVDPFSVKSITEGMHQLHQNEDLRQELIQLGRERQALFSWDKSAELMWNSIEKCLE